MRFVNPIPFVRDINFSKKFYCEVLGLKVIADHGNFVLFETGFAIHDGQSLQQTIWKQTAGDGTAYGRGNLLLYFEDEDIDALFARISADIRLIHPIEQRPWGQRVFRFYDPDGHAIEVGEPLAL